MEIENLKSEITKQANRLHKNLDDMTSQTLEIENWLNSVGGVRDVSVDIESPLISSVGLSRIRGRYRIVVTTKTRTAPFGDTKREERIESFPHIKSLLAALLEKYRQLNISIPSEDGSK